MAARPLLDERGETPHQPTLAVTPYRPSGKLTAVEMLGIFIDRCEELAGSARLEIAAFDKGGCSPDYELAVTKVLVEADKATGWLTQAYTVRIHPHGADMDASRSILTVDRAMMSQPHGRQTALGILDELVKTFEELAADATSERALASISITSPQYETIVSKVLGAADKAKWLTTHAFAMRTHPDSQIRAMSVDGGENLHQVRRRDLSPEDRRSKREMIKARNSSSA